MILFKDPEAQKKREMLEAAVAMWHKGDSLLPPTVRIRLRCTYCHGEHLRDCSNGDGYQTTWGGVFGRHVPIIEEIPRWFREPMPVLSYITEYVLCPHCRGMVREVGREPIIAEQP